MEAIFIPSKHDSEVEQLLSHPYQLLPLMFESEQSDFIVFAHDLEQRLTYMSNSAWNVCKLDFKNWHKRSYVPMMTEHPWNDSFKTERVTDLKSGEIQKLNCEIWNDEGGRAQLQVWRRLVFFEDEPIGVVGISKRLEATETPSTLKSSNPFDSLTPSELEVVRLVVNGALNKSIAARMGVAIRTVEMRRSKAMKKLGVKTLSNLVKLWCQFHLEP